MRRSIGFWWVAVVAIAAILLMQNGGGWGVEANSSPDPGDSQLLQTLINLDRKYAAVARPSLRSGPATETEMGPKVQRAINMLRLQHLEKLYGDRARPRFGKRMKPSQQQYSAPSSVDYENQMVNNDMMNDWLPDRR